MKKLNKNINIPDEAKKVLFLLEENGHSAYLVGGYIRDKIRTEADAPQDIDIATSATPNETERLFASSEWTTYPLGKRFGTIGVVSSNKSNTVPMAQN